MLSSQNLDIIYIQNQRSNECSDFHMKSYLD
ncbi:hypothetical protein VPHD239_0032 [Vibrio phage D239]